MEARLLHVSLVAAALLSLGANARTENFIVTASTPQLAQEVAQYAERYRRELAIEWLGSELPPWTDKCPITVHVAPGRPAGGQTSFVFIRNEPRQWQMVVEGSRERVLDSVLPHEVTHTILATHFGCPLPRWADEGACTTVEHVSERRKQDQLLIQFLTQDRGIPFNKLFAMRDYPQDILPLYSQGYSLARYLIAQGGKRKFIEYVGDGLRMQTPDAWTRATQKHYGFRNLSELQLSWVEWVRVGSPENVAPRGSEQLVAAEPNKPDVALASLDQPITGSPSAELADGSTTTIPAPQAAPTEPAQPRTLAPAVAATARPVPAPAAAATDAAGWYARQRDLANERRQGEPRVADASDPYRPTVRPRSSVPQSSARQPGMQRPGQIVLEWQRGE